VTSRMGACVSTYAPQDVQTAENMARVCRMRKQVLGRQHAEILIRAKKAKEDEKAGKVSGGTLRPMALQMRQMRQQMSKLEEVEMNFINIASISQTTGALQGISRMYSTIRNTEEDVNIDDVLDLQDALVEQQEAFSEIDRALSQAWTDPFSTGASSGGPSSGPDTSQEKLLEQELEEYIAETDPTPPESVPEPAPAPPANEPPVPEIPSPPSSLTSTTEKRKSSTLETEFSEQVELSYA